MRPLDATDLGILTILQDEARASAAELARRGGRSESTIRERMGVFASNNLIRSYRAELDLELVCPTTEATVYANLDLRELPRIRAALTALPCVLAADVLSGSRGIMIHVIARSISDLAAVVRRDIAPLGFEDIEIRVTMASLVRTRTAVLPAPAKRGASPAQPFIESVPSP